jgi:hypothetical protein
VRSLSLERGPVLAACGKTFFLVYRNRIPGPRPGVIGGK